VVRIDEPISPPARVETAPSGSRLPRRPMLRRRTAANAGRSFTLTFIGVVLLAAFLSPLARSALVSIKSPDQVSQASSPVWPADPKVIDYQGQSLTVYAVPLDGGERDLALLTKGRASSTFVDPQDLAASPITWVGSWRSLTPVWTFAPKLSNYADVWDQVNFPRLLLNTILIALISMLGVLVSCTLVAYAFARFRFPGRNLVFMLVIATIFLPSAVTLIPTYTIFVKIGWVGTWLPLLVPAFFANAYDVFLLRQYLMTIPREMDEAAAIDGAGPFRTLVSVILPQAWPVIIAVGIFHFVYSWNDFLLPTIYLVGHEDLVPLSVGLAHLSGLHNAQNPGMIQAGTMLTILIPIAFFLLFQRMFVRGIVITGVEK
jgi:multiple sugar transport system permease protein